MGVYQPYLAFFKFFFDFLMRVGPLYFFCLLIQSIDINFWQNYTKQSSLGLYDDKQENMTSFLFFVCMFVKKYE